MMRIHFLRYSFNVKICFNCWKDILSYNVSGIFVHLPRIRSISFEHSSIEIKSILIHHGLGFHFILLENYVPKKFNDERISKQNLQKRVLFVLLRDTLTFHFKFICVYILERFS